MGGNWDTGSSRMQIAPASTIMRAIAAANIGRVMKKFTEPPALTRPLASQSHPMSTRMMPERRRRCHARDG